MVFCMSFIPVKVHLDNFCLINVEIFKSTSSNAFSDGISSSDGGHKEIIR